MFTGGDYDRAMIGISLLTLVPGELGGSETYVRELVNVPTVQEIKGGNTVVVARLDFGVLREAIEAWDSDARVAVVTSGGLSHFTVDEDIDRLALKGLTSADGQILSTLPRYKLQSATTEILNWVAAAGAMGETPMDLITYQPGYRSPAGTGCGCAVGRWIPE